MALRLVSASPKGGSGQKVETGSKALVRQRLQAALTKNNFPGRKAFTDALKSHGIQPDALLRLMQEACRDKEGLIVWEKKIAAMYELKTLAHVRPLSSFSKLLIVIRELYAEDIALFVSFEDAARIAIEEVLISP